MAVHWACSKEKRKSDASEAYPRVPYWLEQPQIGYHFAQVGNKQEYNKAMECNDVIMAPMGRVKGGLQASRKVVTS